MKRLILFRYHDINPSICLERIKLLKKYNPKTKIFGLYGGNESSYHYYNILFESYIVQNYCIKNKPRAWKWKNVDFAILEWFKNIGKKLNFDMLHIVEWDLLMFDSLEHLYKTIKIDEIGLTGLNKISNLIDKWFWIKEKDKLKQWNELLFYVKEKYKYNDIPFGSLGPGLCLPKTFLEDLSKIEIPELCNDEIRLPLFGQILGYKICNTGFCKKWFDLDENQYFNCIKQEIDINIINFELNIKKGRRVFHPFYKKIVQ